MNSECSELVSAPVLYFSILAGNCFYCPARQSVEVGWKVIILFFLFLKYPVLKFEHHLHLVICVEACFLKWFAGLTGLCKLGWKLFLIITPEKHADWNFCLTVKFAAVVNFSTTFAAEAPISIYNRRTRKPYWEEQRYKFIYLLRKYNQRL